MAMRVGAEEADRRDEVRVARAARPAGAGRCRRTPGPPPRRVGGVRLWIRATTCDVRCSGRRFRETRRARRKVGKGVAQAPRRGRADRFERGPTARLCSAAAARRRRRWAAVPGLEDSGQPRSADRGAGDREAPEAEAVAVAEGGDAQQVGGLVGRPAAVRIVVIVGERHVPPQRIGRVARRRGNSSATRCGRYCRGASGRSGPSANCPWA